MTDPKQRPDPRQQPGSVRKEDPNLGQKEAEREKAELEEEDDDDELEPMTDRQAQRREPPSTD
jgi:hypothetical protein